MKGKFLFRKKPFVIGIYLIPVFFLPLFSLTRNPDFLHDAYFFSQAKALNSGMFIHRDLYSPYGILVPLLISLITKFFGDYLIIVRILGWLVNLGTLLLMFNLLKRKLTLTNTIIFICLFVALSPERTELDSSRWIYGLGIWPTHITILLTLIVFWITVAIFEKSTLNFGLYSRMTIAALLVPMLLIARLQGILIFTTFVLFLIGYCFSNRREIQKRAFIVLICILSSSSLMFFCLAKKDVLQLTFSSMLFDPFNSASNTLNGRWSSWLLGLLFSLVSSVIALALLLTLISVALRRINGYVAIIGFSIVLGISFWYSGTFNYPHEFNGNILLWVMKIMSKFPAWIPWGLVISFLIASVGVILSIFRNSHLSSKLLLSFLFDREKMMFVLVGGASYSHLFWNYSYSYSLFPITLISLIFISEEFRSLVNGNKVLKSLATITILICTFVSIIGFAKPTYSYTNKLLLGFKDTRSYSKDMEKNLEVIRLQSLGSPSLYYCDYPIYRYFYVESYKQDLNLQSGPSISRIEYLRTARNSTNTVMICGKENFFSSNELEQSGWREKTKLLASRNTSLSIQILTLASGG